VRRLASDPAVQGKVKSGALVLTIGLWFTQTTPALNVNQSKF
jgi:hypothetical protein